MGVEGTSHSVTFLLIWTALYSSVISRDATTVTEALSCEAGWSMSEGECIPYVYADQSVSFDQALTTCLNLDAVLPIVHSEIDWSHRIRQISDHSHGNAWLGLRYKPQNASFLWMDGSAMRWSNFQVSPFPVNRTRTNCVYANITGNYSWVVENCLEKNHFICIKPPFRATTTAITEQLTTSGAQATTDGGNFKTTTEAVQTTSLPVCGSSLAENCALNSSLVAGWETARMECQQQTSTLFLTKSKAEWISFQAGRVANSNLDNIWVGIRYNEMNNRMESSDGVAWQPEPYDWYPWAEGQPPTEDTFNSDSCVASKKALNYMWDFEDCNQSYVGVCRNQVQMDTTTISTSTKMTTTAQKWTFTLKADEDVTTGITQQSDKPARYFTPRPMSKAERITSVVIQTMGCAFVIGGLSLTLVLFVMFRNLSMEKIIIANQDLALLFAHSFVLALREPSLYPSMSPQLCKCVAILLHYFFTCGYTFMLLEALQMMYIVGHVSRSGAILPTYAVLLLGWGCPLAMVTITGPIIGDEYVTYWTCWGDLERRFGWALFFPMVCICSCTVIIVESAGMMNRQDPPYDADSVQLFSAKVSQRGIVIVMSLTIVSHVLGVVAVYFQLVYLYVVCFGLNVSCGVAVVFFHTAVDSKIRAFVINTWRKIKCCRRKEHERKYSTAKVKIEAARSVGNSRQREPTFMM